MNVTFALVPLLVSYPIMADALVVETDMQTYHYGDTLTILITVDEISEIFATMHIRDATGKSSSPINVPLEGMTTTLPSLAPFDRTVYPSGIYFVDVLYGGMVATTSFELVDAGGVVVANWIKQVAYHWVIGEIPGVDYLAVLGSLVDEGVLTADSSGTRHIPGWLTVPTMWWLDGSVSDLEYITMIQYVAGQGVITGLVGTG